jgi:hypothetical protein
MIVRETWVGGGPFTAYRIPDIHHSDDRGRHQKHVSCINTFFHRSARDGIKYNVTNQRRLLESDDVSFLKDVEIRLEHGQEPLYEIVECADIDDFFWKIGFDYATKTWALADEWSMRFKFNSETGGCFVDPPVIQRHLAKSQSA